VLLRHLDRFPLSWREHAAALCATSDRLFTERGHAFYGDEDDLVPPSELFDRAEADEAISAVDRLLVLYRELLEESPAERG
jgi:hypothetical protein